LDDTARAIARLNEEAKAEKAAESRKGDPSAPKRQIPQSVNGMGRRKVVGPTPQTSTKRPKTGGA
jgi:hypothetical protein